MTIRALGLIALACASASAQSTAGPFFVQNEIGRIGVTTSLRSDPPSAALQGRFTASTRGRTITQGPTFYSRILLDRANNVYFGYELLLDQQQPGTYLATFGKLGVTPLDLAAGSLPKGSANPAAWTMSPIPAIPEPRVIHDGETVTIDLFVDPATGAKLIEDIRINPPSSAVARVPPPIPTVSGVTRNFAVTDAELQIIQPRLMLNNKLQAYSGPSFRNVHGPLVWLYLPDHGRYILSLAPHATLGFHRAGEVRSGVLTLTLDDDSIKVECVTPIATGNAPYNLYVLHQDDWEPVAERQKDWPAAGTVGIDELTALNRK